MKKYFGTIRKKPNVQIEMLCGHLPPIKIFYQLKAQIFLESVNEAVCGNSINVTTPLAHNQITLKTHPSPIFDFYVYHKPRFIFLCVLNPL